MRFHVTTLATLSNDALAAAFNLVYTGYMLPVRFSGAQMRAHVDGNDIVLAQSPLWLDEAGTVVAMAMLGVRERRGWIGGFGVAPDWRGQGLSHTLNDAALSAAHEAGLDQVQLEVITSNTRAIRAYERAGFEHTRDLNIFMAAPETIAALPSIEVAAHPADPQLLLAQRAGIGGAARPPWQREPDGLAREREQLLRGLALGPHDAPTAYVVYRISSDALALADIAAPDEDSVLTLLGTLAQAHPNLAMRLINEPHESAVTAALERLGWDEPLRQHEMLYQRSRAVVSSV